jgi:hypothetical protein
MRFASLVVILLLIGCSAAPEKKSSAPPPPPPVKDNTALLLDANRTGARVVQDHVLGVSALPGGSVGDYEAGHRKYQLFVIETESPQSAAILLLDMKSSLTDAAYIAYMGGYFGAEAGAPVYVFSKGKYLAGVAGLPKDTADPIARQLAARL